MKKLFVSLLAVAALAACTNEQTLVQRGNAPMEFAGAFVDNATRANVAADPSTTTNSLTGFDVWAFMDKPAGKLFEGEDVTGEQGNFTYVNTQYWLPGHDYYFAALAPMNSANWKLNTEAANTYGAGIVDFHNVDGTEDLLYAATSVSTHDMELGQSMEAVKFQFNHLLSKVKFTFINGFDNANAYIDVKEVTMEVPAFASINLAQQDWWSTNQWALVKDQYTTLAFGDACAKTAPGVKQETDDERLTIPAGADQEYKVTFKVQLYFGDVAAFAEVQTLTSEVKGVALEMGKAYNFTAEINASNISEDGKELLPIVFDVEEVKDWVDAGEQTGIIGGVSEDMTLFTNAEATSTVVVKGTFDGAGHTITVAEGTEAFYKDGQLNIIELNDGEATIQNVTIDGNYASWYNAKTGKTYNIRNINATAGGTYNIIGVTSINCAYPLHSQTDEEVVFNVVDSTLEGWLSYNANITANFEDVQFTTNPNTYGRFRPYGTTVCKNCKFDAAYIIDLGYLAAGETITFIGCTKNGAALTAADLTAAEGKAVVIE